MGFTSPSLNVVIDYFFSFLSKMCKICLKRTLEATFLDCLVSTFCDVVGKLLPEWACLTLRGGTTFLLTSKLADIPVSRVRIDVFCMRDWHLPELGQREWHLPEHCEWRIAQPIAPQHYCD